VCSGFGSGIQMLALLVPVLVNFLLEGPAFKDASRFCQLLHERSLQWLMKIGVQYPQVRPGQVLTHYLPGSDCETPPT